MPYPIHPNPHLRLVVRALPPFLTPKVCNHPDTSPSLSLYASLEFLSAPLLGCACNVLLFVHLDPGAGS